MHKTTITTVKNLPFYKKRYVYIKRVVKNNRSNRSLFLEVNSC